MHEEPAPALVQPNPAEDTGRREDQRRRAPVRVDPSNIYRPPQAAGMQYEAAP